MSRVEIFGPAPSDCTCTWGNYNEFSYVLVTPDSDCPLHGHGEPTCTYPVDLPDGACDNDAMPGSLYCRPHAEQDRRTQATSDDMDRPYATTEI